MNCWESVLTWSACAGGCGHYAEVSSFLSLSCTDIETSMGIFYWDMDANIKSLLDYLVPTTVRGSAIAVSLLREDDWNQLERQRYSGVIVIYSSQTDPSSMKRILDFCSSKYGAEHMVKVFIDAEDAESQERNHSEYRQSSPCLQVTLTEAELDAISPSDNVSIGRRMADKVKQMRKILQDNSGFPRLWYDTAVVGIFSREAESQYSWLIRTLRSHLNMDRVPELRPCAISNSGLQKFYQDLSQCKFGILYHSKNRGRVNVTDMVDALYDQELKALSSTYGREKVIVVIDDLEDSGDADKSRILSQQPSIGTLAAGLFLISLEEKTSNYQRHLLVTREQVEKKLQELIEWIRKVVPGGKAERSMHLPGAREKSRTIEQNKSKSGENTTQTASGVHQGEDYGISGPVPAGSEKPGSQPEKEESIIYSFLKTIQSVNFDFPDFVGPVFYKKSIGIFSRSSESEYSWLKMLLESQDFRDCVQSVRSCPVSNVFSEFRNEVTRCTFGILYHSKNRGRINVTDVTDSLYDEELKLLYSRLGKKNVVVVIDDLDDASDAMKNKLLSAQHSIEKLSGGLILVERSSSEGKRRATRNALRKVFQ